MMIDQRARGYQDLPRVWWRCVWSWARTMIFIASSGCQRMRASSILRQQLAFYIHRCKKHGPTKHSRCLLQFYTTILTPACQKSWVCFDFHFETNLIANRGLQIIVPGISEGVWNSRMLFAKHVLPFYCPHTMPRSLWAIRKVVWRIPSSHHGLAITGSCDQLSVSANTSSETNRCEKEEDVVIKKTS